MKVIEQVAIVEDSFYRQDVLGRIEKAARTCYKSEGKICQGSASKMLTKLIQRGHEAMLEHACGTVRFVTDRGVTHEMVRHRIASFAQESTRYCNYNDDRFGKELTFIKPVFWDNDDDTYATKTSTMMYRRWEGAMRMAEKAYMEMIEDGANPGEARTVLPNSLKTEIVVTANMREWRRIFVLRTAPDAHPQMVALMKPLLGYCASIIPELFGDIAQAQQVDFGHTIIQAQQKGLEVR